MEHNDPDARVGQLLDGGLASLGGFTAAGPGAAHGAPPQILTTIDMETPDATATGSRA